MNGWVDNSINGREGTALPYRRIQLVNVEGKTKIENYHQANTTVINTCCRQDPLMDAKISGGMFEEKTAYLYNLKYLPQDIY